MIILPFIYFSSILLIVGETAITILVENMWSEHIPHEQLRQKVEHSLKMPDREKWKPGKLEAIDIPWYFSNFSQEN